MANARTAGRYHDIAKIHAADSIDGFTLQFGFTLDSISAVSCFTKDGLKPTSRRILALWKSNPGLKASLTDVRSALGAKKSQALAIRDILSELISANHLNFKKGHYILSSKPPPSDKKPKKENGAPPSTTRKRAPGKAKALSSNEPQLVGTFAAHPNGFGFVECQERRESLFIPPRYVAGALDGDWVSVVEEHPSGRVRPYAKVVEVLKRRRVTTRGHLHREHGQTWVAPLNERIPMVFIPEGESMLELTDNALVEVEITHYPEHPNEAPEGRLLAQLDEDESPTNVIQHILSECGLEPGFSKEAQAEATAMPKTVKVPPGDDRVDLQQRMFITIDGKDAKDFDDAICLETLENGNQLMLVSIADVGEYVYPGTAIEADAYEKGTSVYFPGSVYPMLPALLSNGLCSLKPNVQRLTLTCEMELNPEGERVGFKIYESVIKSHARLTYGEVQQYFDTGRRNQLGTELCDMLDRMRKMAQTLREKRTGRGSLDFLFPEYRFELDRKGFPKKIYGIYPTEATRLIEQFMLEANETTALHCFTRGIPILYRVHDPPPSTQMPQLLAALWNFGVEVKASSLDTPMAMQQLLTKAKDHPQREQVELAILKTMSQAQYREQQDAHYALAAEHYAHFTSPIRRFPDLLMHRGIKADLRGKGTAGSKTKAPPLPLHAGLHLSEKERNAGEAEQKVIRLFKVLYMESRVGQSFPARVVGTSDRGLFVGLRDIPVEGLIPMEQLPGANWKYDKERGKLLGRGKKSFAAGDKLTVTLERTDRLTQQMGYAFVDWEWQDSPEPADSAGSGD